MFYVYIRLTCAAAPTVGYPPSRRHPAPSRSQFVPRDVPPIFCSHQEKAVVDLRFLPQMTHLQTGTSFTLQYEELVFFLLPNNSVKPSKLYVLQNKLYIITVPNIFISQYFVSCIGCVFITSKRSKQCDKNTFWPILRKWLLSQPRLALISPKHKVGSLTVVKLFLAGIVVQTDLL